MKLFYLLFLTFYLTILLTFSMAEASEFSKIFFLLISTDPFYVRENSI